MAATRLPRGPAVPLPLTEVATLAADPSGRSLSAEGSRPVGWDGVLVTGVTLDSRDVQPGDLYAALPGARTHGARFCADAAAAGAVAVLTDPPGAPEAAQAGLPAIVVADPRAVLGAVAAGVYGHPAGRLTSYGVTGTNGKTTTTYLLAESLRSAGLATGLIGTVQIRVLDETLPSVRTTPEAPEVQALLSLMVSRGVREAAMEVSSHALSFGRVDGIVFDVAGFTNLSQDHLDFHPTMEDYFAAKAQLFTPAHARRGVICVDDEWGRRLADHASIPVVTLRTAEEGPAGADWQVHERAVERGGTRFVLHGPGGIKVAARSPLPGDFNVSNTALALVMLILTGHDPEIAAWRLGHGVDFVPGRMERVTSTDAAGSDLPGATRVEPPRAEPLAVVDYAHTPDAVAKALRSLRTSSHGQLVVVLGAGGDRDRAKRPGMGAAAAQHADVVIVTDDNPRSEDPAAIRAAVLEGVRGMPAAVVLEIGDRAAAIAEGVARAWDGGTLLVAGKGHERGQEIAGVVHPFDDRRVLAAALKQSPARYGGGRSGERAEEPADDGETGGGR